MATLYYPLQQVRVRQIISGHYGPKKCRFGAGIRTNADGTARNHTGIDFEAPVGTPVFAISDGTIYWRNSQHSGFGLELLLRFEQGGQPLFAQYAHLGRVSVAIQGVGSLSFYNGSFLNYNPDYNKLGNVTGGDLIGYTGKSGNASNLPRVEDHLHFEIRKKMWCASILDRYDPELILGAIPG